MHIKKILKSLTENFRFFSSIEKYFKVCAIFDQWNSIFFLCIHLVEMYLILNNKMGELVFGVTTILHTHVYYVHRREWKLVFFCVLIFVWDAVNVV